jgi:hypothetical protein
LVSRSNGHSATNPLKMSIIQRSSAVGDFFDNYFKQIDDNHDESTYWKVFQKQQFIFDSMNIIENNIFNIMQQHPFANIGMFSDYRGFKHCYNNYANFKMDIVTFFSVHEIYYELFSIYRSALLTNNVDDMCEKVKQLCIKHENDKNYSWSIIKPNVVVEGRIVEESFVRLDGTIKKYALNAQIVNIFCAFQQLESDVEKCKQVISTLNYNIDCLRCRYGFINNPNGMNLYVNLFTTTNPQQIHNSLVWTCFRVPDGLFNELRNIFIEQHNFLLQLIENKQMNNVTKLQKSQTPIVKKATPKPKPKKQPEISDAMDVVVEESEKKKTRKTTIPPALRKKVWNKWIGEAIGKAKCLCCNHNDISQLEFACGHIVAEFNGGKTELNNLKPICKSCNSSMGTKHMDEYMREFGFAK